MKRLWLQRNPRITLFLNFVFVLYVFMLPLSKAFILSTAPWIIVILWILEGGMKEKWNTIKQPPLIYLILFLIWSALSILWSLNTDAGLHVLKFYIAFVIPTIAFATFLKSSFYKPLIYAFIVSMVINEILCYGIFFEWWHFHDRSPAYPTPPKIDHIRYSIFLAITLVILLWQLLSNSSSKWVRISEGIFFVSAFANLFVNGGRTGQVAFVFAVFVFFHTMKLLSWRRTVLLTLLLFLSIVTAYKISPVFQTRANQALSDMTRVIKHHDFHGSWGNRLAIYATTLHAIERKPVLGYGLGSFKEAIEGLKNSISKDFWHIGMNLSSPHNDFLYVTLQSGLPALFLLALFFTALLKTHPKETRDKAVFYAILMILFFSMMTNYLLKNNTTGLMAFLFGYFLNSYYARQGRSL